MKLPLFLKKYFWDVDFSKIDFKRRTEYVILRILEYGDIKDVCWLLRNINKNKIKKVILSQRNLSLKSFYFWSLFFRLNNKKNLCLKKSYQKMQKSHWPY